MQSKTHRKVFSSLLAASMLLSPAFTLIVSANELTDSTSQPVDSQSNNSSTIIYEYYTKNDNGNAELKSGSIQIPKNNVLTITESGTYTLKGNAKCSIVVRSKEGAENPSVTLDLGSYILTNADSQHTITVHKGSSLTIQGNGTVDNVSNGKAAVYNEGSTTLSGGTYSRSKEIKTDNVKNKNTYYTIENRNEMVIQGDVTVIHADQHGTETISSLVRNYGMSTDAPARMNIISGKFFGGSAAIKNDFNGILNISGGEIHGYLIALQNWNVATVSGGIFGLSSTNTVPTTPSNGGVIANSAYKAKGEYTQASQGNLKITGSTLITTKDSNGNRVCLTNHLYSQDDENYVGVNADEMNDEGVNNFEVSSSVRFEGLPTEEGNEGLIDIQKPTPSKPSTNRPVGSQKVQDMHRLYNPNSGEHFYTANLGEKHHLVSLGWVDEGVGWTAPAKSNTPVYRLYNPNAGDHHYTLNGEERDYLVAAGWNDEGIGFYSDDKESAPLYRSYNPNAVTGSHNYTLNKAEHQYLTSIGWRDEAIAWYGTK